MPNGSSPIDDGNDGSGGLSGRGLGCTRTGGVDAGAGDLSGPDGHGTHAAVSRQGVRESRRPARARFYNPATRWRMPRWTKVSNCALSAVAT